MGAASGPINVDLASLELTDLGDVAESQDVQFLVGNPKEIAQSLGGIGLGPTRQSLERVRLYDCGIDVGAVEKVHEVP
jgi:hypothetical protein